MLQSFGIDCLSIDLMASYRFWIHKLLSLSLPELQATLNDIPTSFDLWATQESFSASYYDDSRSFKDIGPTTTFYPVYYCSKKSHFDV